MFDQATWRRQIAEQLNGFARNPRQEMQLAGAPSLLSYLVARTLAPFLEAFQREPIAAVLTLAAITHTPGADQIVQRATRLRYQSAAQIERELRSSKDIRVAAEQLLLELQTVALVRQRLNGGREEWARTMLDRELEMFVGEFGQLRRALSDPGWQTRSEALRALRNRKGRYTPADLVLIHDGLTDSAAHVRAAAARMLGLIAEPPGALLQKTLVRVALHDSDAETRVAAARAIGMLREYLTSPQLLDQLSACLFSDDSFVRSAVALVLGELGDMVSAPLLIKNLARLLSDIDPYAREAAARALGRIGTAAATPEVLAALSRAVEDDEITVHEAASDALDRLADLRPASALAVASP
ncbi:HEAT repeat domain-containing protein [Kouleothrix sp.]|uniref:HEAT repeat domain-containing protein n=1 Tax=Kouleothrix sp. TaxID=2779161 RepID=UPI00391C5E53